MKKCTMNIKNSEDESSPPQNREEVDTPRKRMRSDNSCRKSWSLMDRKTDHEVLQEMGVSLLEPDDSEAHHDGTHHHRSHKRKHNRENVNPHPNTQSPRKSPRKALSPSAGTSRPSPRSCDKVKPLTESNLDVTQITNAAIDEETPLAQSVSAEYVPALAHARQPYSALGAEEVKILSRQPAWEPTEPDSFAALSDEVMLGVFRWLPKRTLATAMLLCKRWYRVACDETLWQRLDLGNKTISRGALGRILARKPVILRLASSEIGDWHPTTPLEPSRIQYLDLSMCSISASTLGCLLAVCPALKKLSLESVHVDDAACQIIGECASLETLNLTMAQGITAAGLTHILTRCAGLQSLNISWCNLSEESLQAVVTMAPQGLQRLNLGGARLMTDDMVSTLCSRCPLLCELDLSDCGRIGARSPQALLGLRHLEHLALSRAYLLPAASLALVEILTPLQTTMDLDLPSQQLNSMPSLQYLEVWGMLAAASLSALRAALPAVTINQFMFSAIARPTVGTRRTSIWGLRTRD